MNDLKTGFFFFLSSSSLCHSGQVEWEGWGVAVAVVVVEGLKLFIVLVHQSTAIFRMSFITIREVRCVSSPAAPAVEPVFTFRGIRGVLPFLPPLAPHCPRSMWRKKNPKRDEWRGGGGEEKKKP